jgi:hypothetical protein
VQYRDQLHPGSEAETTMARYGRESKLKPLTVLKRAVAFWGPDGIGLEVQSQSLTSVHFAGSGGHVSIQVRKSERGSEVELETREWDYQVQKFMGKI